MRIDPVELITRYKKSFIDYSVSCLKILDKNGNLIPFILNKAQLYLHKIVEKQLQEKGMIRVIILKGRQQGISTYIAGRLFWKITSNFGKRAYVIAHEQSASDNLFSMTQRFYDNSPSIVAPHVGKSNAKELYMDKLDSGYKVTTAGSKATGRSGTAQYLHASEVAFWDNAMEHMAGIGQTVPNIKGTEVFLESTANGINNIFHELWQKAIRGESGYLPIFIPWYWQPEYRMPIDKNFKVTKEEQILIDTYKLDYQQIAWRRHKISTDFNDDISLFQQEYPCSTSEAFRYSGSESFIDSSIVMKARSNKVEDVYGPTIIGVDPARFGDNNTVIAIRKGNKLLEIKTLQKYDTMQIVGYVSKLIEEKRPNMVFIDVGGLGAGVVDRLNELGYGHVITSVNFGSKSIMPEEYINMRSQMWGEMKKWLSSGLVEIPDDDLLQADLIAPTYKYDSLQRIVLETKDSMRSRGLKSPDRADALALTFAYPVANTDDYVVKTINKIRKYNKKFLSPMAA